MAGNERDRFLYTDLLVRSGAVVFSAARGDQYSYESASVGNGFFTAALLQALAGELAECDPQKTGTMRWRDLRGAVSAKVEEQTGGLQTPCVDRDNRDCDLLLPMRIRRWTSPGRALAVEWTASLNALAVTPQADRAGIMAMNVKAVPLLRAIVEAAERELRRSPPDPAEASRLLRHAAALAGGTQAFWERQFGDAVEPAECSLLLDNGVSISGRYDPVREALLVIPRDSALPRDVPISAAIDPARVQLAGLLKPVAKP